MVKKPPCPFRDVRILDAVALEEWIARAPSVAAWLYNECKVGRSGPISALSWVGKVWCEVTDPPLDSVLLRDGRIREAENLLHKLREGTRSMTVQADSPLEAEAWVAAVLTQACGASDQTVANFWRHWLDRSVVCRNISILDELLHHPPLLILLQDGSNANPLIRAGHTVICTPGRQTPGGSADITLSRPLRQEFSSALQLMYQPNLSRMDAERRAEIDAKACGSSASVWRIWNLLQASCESVTGFVSVGYGR